MCRAGGRRCPSKDRRKSTKVLVQAVREDKLDDKQTDTLASSPNTPPVVLLNMFQHMSAHGQAQLQQAIATNPATPTEALVQGVQKKTLDPGLMLSLAGNPGTPTRLLYELSRSDNPDVLQRLAGNPNTPVEILSRFATGDDPKLRMWAFQNKATPEDAKEQARFLATPKDAQPFTQSAEYKLASSTRAPGDELRKLAKTKSLKVHQTLAWNASAPEDVLGDIYHQHPTDKHVLRGLAGNPNSPAYVLTNLIHSGDPFIVDEVLRNPATPEHVREGLVRARKNAQAKARKDAVKKVVKSAFTDSSKSKPKAKARKRK